MGDGGKGDKRRPGDAAAFDDGYDRIFGDKKPVRGRFIWDESVKKLVPAEEYFSSRPDVSAPFVMDDIKPYRSQATGEEISSRSTHREHLRRHRLTEVGDQTHYLRNKPREIAPGLKQAVIEAAHKHLR